MIIIRRKKADYLKYVCPKCFNQVNKCTCKIYPPWQLIFIDERMQEIIRILNQKNYTTISCCETHYYNSLNMYVTFGIDYNLTPPEGFTYSKKEKAIEHLIKEKDKEKFESEKTKYLEILTKWAQELPDRN